ncbi:hypothetical protein CVS40_10425 [Lucilia cuprina]|nr:hypothetical protein CVS40_10425 [Lucilia cuprina]
MLKILKLTYKPLKTQYIMLSFTMKSLVKLFFICWLMVVTKNVAAADAAAHATLQQQPQTLNYKQQLQYQMQQHDKFEYQQQIKQQQQYYQQQYHQQQAPTSMALLQEQQQQQQKYLQDQQKQRLQNQQQQQQFSAGKPSQQTSLTELGNPSKLPPYSSWVSPRKGLFTNNHHNDPPVTDSRGK